MERREKQITDSNARRKTDVTSMVGHSLIVFVGVWIADVWSIAIDGTVVTLYTCFSTLRV